MDMEKMNHTLHLLALARQNAEKAKAKRDALIKVIEQGQEFINANQDYYAAQTEAEHYTMLIKQECEAAFIETGEKQYPGVTVKEITGLELKDETAAVEYAMKEGFTSVDWKGLEKYAKAVKDTVKALPFYKMVTKPQAQIKSDLSEFLLINRG